MKYLDKLEEAKKKKKGRCWTGYKPKAGSVPYSKGSCVKEAYKLIGLALIEAKVDDGLTVSQKDQARSDRSNPLKNAPDELAQKTEKSNTGHRSRSKAMRRIRVNLARAKRMRPETEKAKTYAANRETETRLKRLKASNKFYGVGGGNS